VRVELGAYVLLAEAAQGLWHVPRPHFKPGASARTSLCGLEGELFAYRGVVRRRRACAICRLRAPALRELHAFHVGQHISINRLAGRLYERYGYASAGSMGSAVSNGWKELGLQARDRIEMTVRASLKHGRARRARNPDGTTNVNGPKSRGYKRWLMDQRAGHSTLQPKCVATSARGRRCRRAAMYGSRFCENHEPTRAPAALAHLARMRARSPVHRPENLTTAGEFQTELAAYFAASGGRWKPLTAATGLSNSALARYLRCPPEKRVTLEQAARIRRGLAAVQPGQPAAPALPPGARLGRLVVQRETDPLLEQLADGLAAGVHVVLPAEPPEHAKRLLATLGASYEVESEAA